MWFNVEVLLPGIQRGTYYSSESGVNQKEGDLIQQIFIEHLLSVKR